MSETTRPGRDDLERTMTTRLGAAAPLEPDAGALGRVRARAERLPADRPSTTRLWHRPAVRLALAAVVTVVAIGASVAVISRPGDVAFARDKLLAVLAPPGTVLHYVETSQSSWLSQAGLSDGEMVTEYWIDTESEAMRVENRFADGTLQSVRIESDGRKRHLVETMQFDADGRPLGEDEIAGPEWMLMEFPATDAFTPAEQSDFNPLWWLDQVRNAVVSGRAEVVRTTTVGGDRCWEIEWRSELDGPGPVTTVDFSATVRQSDYRPVRYETVVEQDGRQVGRHANAIVSWELLPRRGVDDALFDRTALGSDTSGVTTENRIYTPADLSDFSEFGAWWLGPEFEGLPLTGQPSYSEDGDARALPEVYFNRLSMGSGWLAAAGAGELTMAYSATGLDEGSPDTIRVTVAASEPGADLEGLIADLMRTSQRPRQSTDTDETVWREVAGRRYVERIETSADGTFSRALLVLDGAAVLIAAPDSETTARAVAALVKAN